MKNIKFLIKLKKEGKINLMASSEEVKESYLKDSESYFISSKMLFKDNRLKESTQLIYFSVYYSILALLFKVGVKSENHLGSIILLKELFSLDNLFVLMLQKKRVGTYYPDFELEKQELNGLIQKAEEFNLNLLDFISKLTNEQIKIYRNKFINLLK
ncbi:MAG: HEPN domain-containing protein [Nanoarchaeota archaeon]